MKNKKFSIPAILSILVVFLMLLGATFAYFQAQGGDAVTSDVRITAHTVDRLSLFVDQNISIEATQQNFTNGGNNLSSTATATAMLTPNSKTGAATKHYYLYLQLDENEIGYSTANTNETAELLLQVFNSSDQLVTLTGLGNQVTVGSLTGYDITGLEGLHALLDNHEITASNNTATTETWRVVITLINHNFNQNENTGKEVNGSVIISEEEVTNPTKIELLAAKYSLSEPGNVTLSNGMLYYHDENLENGAEDGSYRYSGTNPDNYICFGSDAATCPAINLYRIIGIIPVDVVTDSTTNPVTTETQMLYKIIRKNYLTSSESSNGLGTDYSAQLNNPGVGVVNTYYWSGSSSVSSNNWATSTLNTITLNTDFYGTLSSTWQNKIANVMWKIGGTISPYIYYASDMPELYSHEITYSGINIDDDESFTYLPDNLTEIPNKIGLMYMSDYGYASLASGWGNSPVDSTASTSWLLSEANYEWAITREAYTSVHTYGTGNYGGYDSYNTNTCKGVRPTFYLTENTVIDLENHAGTAADPFRIS